MLTVPSLEDRPLTLDERNAILDRVDEILELTYRSADLSFDDPGRNLFAGDTHGQRVLARVGIAPDLEGNVDSLVYGSAVPKRMRERLHVNLIRHGQQVCRASRPKCVDCPLISFCIAGRARAAATKDHRPVAVELFAGSGGLGEGFTRAKFRVAVAVEMDRDAAQTYRTNHPGTVVLEADATLVSGADLVRLAPHAAQALALAAGPPCQGYSAAGKRKADDARNHLYMAVIDIARDLNVRFVAIENVPGMRKVEGRSYVKTVLGALNEAGYAAKDYLVRACDFGVPQLRHRLVFLAQLASFGAAPPPPARTHCPGHYCESGCGEVAGSKCGREPTMSVLDRLSDLPLLAAGQPAEYMKRGDGEPPLLNGSTMAHSKRVIDKIQRIKPGEGPISYRRLHKDLARTVVAGHRALPVHPTLHRTISVREAARIQGFDDTYVFAGRRSKQPLQVANAVPPALSTAVAAAMLRITRTPAVGWQAELPAINSSGRRTETVASE